MELGKQSYFVMLWKLWASLNKRRKYQFIFIIPLMVIASFAEMLSIGAVIPFLSVLAAPSSLLEVPMIQVAMNLFKIQQNNLLLMLTLIFCIATIFAAAMRILLLSANTKLAFAVGSDLSREIYRKTLYQPYAVHMERNSSDLINSVALKVTNVIYGVILPVLVITSSLIMLAIIFLAILIIEPIIAFVIVCGFGGIYAGIIISTRKKLELNSKKVSIESTVVIKVLQEGLGGIRDVLMDGAQEIYCQTYAKADRSLRRAQASSIFIGQAPRYVMEACGVLIIAGIAYKLSSQPNGFMVAIPLLGSMALAAQRALPIIQQAYSSWASAKGTQAGLYDVIELLNQPMSKNLVAKNTSAQISFESLIELIDVSFTYGKNNSWQLCDIRLEIGKGGFVGFIGKTGSGKSTLIDIVMGLLEPTSGKLVIDGISIDSSNVDMWQKNIAHVPQTIFLSDSSIAENIAFGIPKHEIDYDKVRQAAAIAQLDQAIKDLPQQYETFVGERGIRFSGGQRQRIGIARALYKNPSVLIFDEATSALDNATESELINAISMLPNKPTVLMVAHRLTTLKGCNKIIELEGGRISRVLNYSSLGLD
jgi:ATP-binding cassette, subfamily B, bacterial PglK